MERHAEASQAAIAPLLIGEFGAGRGEPRHVLYSKDSRCSRGSAVFDWPAGEVSILAEERDPTTDGDQRADEVGQFVLARGGLPVDPARLVVLAVRVVVTRLRTTELVAGEEHRRALREEDGREHVAHLLTAQACDGRIVGWTFHAVVERTVVVGAVRACPA